MRPLEGSKEHPNDISIRHFRQETCTSFGIDEFTDPTYTMKHSLKMNSAAQRSGWRPGSWAATNVDMAPGRHLVSTCWNLAKSILWSGLEKPKKRERTRGVKKKKDQVGL